MKIIRYAHATVELEKEKTRLLFDPGEWGERPDLTEFDAVLITHDHFDHVDIDAVVAAQEAKPNLAVYGSPGLAAKIPGLVEVSEGDTFTVGPFSIRVVGSAQAQASIYDDVIPNVGYVVDETVLHPGDAYQPVANIPVLLLPMEGPWTKRAEQEEYLAEFKPQRLIGIHDILLNDFGRGFAKKNLEGFAARIGAQAIWLDFGEAYEL
ncbi:MBL fold metallo-hydrolase [Rothia aerolata]|uniref:Zn-dependent hydrolase n=1 Tax=Rothia aerolata TaxID=1812262 RepID=A0A917INQ6_9MICC|nr:MBL fold metallo-hydrolase [Rothia aerolata]GGH58219.1 Zn-dependent hydrolase [Rothia aerolata]